jgi:phosphatidylglycerol lysyltransferase
VQALLSPFDELLALTSARLRAPFRPSIAEGCGVRSIDECRDAVLRALRDHSELAGQFHALSPDPWRFLWSPCGRAFLPFHERPFAVVAWRDPVGPEEARVPTLRSFHEYARARGKHALVLLATEELASASVSMGFGATWVGSEPFYDLARWTTRGKQGEKLRLAMNHARRLGATAREIFPLRDARDRSELRRVELAWKDARPARRSSSFLRTAPLESAEHRRYFVVETPGGHAPRMQSFLVCSPVSSRGYYLQDLVRHPSAPRGAAELVSVAAIEAFRREGAEFATMGPVPFWDPGGSHETTHVAAVRWVIQHFDKLYRFSGLRQFRAKFTPTRARSQFALHWPRILTPLAAWGIVSVLAPSRPNLAE